MNNIKSILEELSRLEEPVDYPPYPLEQSKENLAEWYSQFTEQRNKLDLERHRLEFELSRFCNIANITEYVLGEGNVEDKEAEFISLFSRVTQHCNVWQGQFKSHREYSVNLVEKEKENFDEKSPEYSFYESLIKSYKDLILARESRAKQPRREIVKPTPTLTAQDLQKILKFKSAQPNFPAGWTWVITSDILRESKEGKLEGKFKYKVKEADNLSLIDDAVEFLDSCGFTVFAGFASGQHIRLDGKTNDKTIEVSVSWAKLIENKS